MKKTLIIPLFALLFAAGAPLALANNDKSDNSRDREISAKIDAKAELKANALSRYFKDKNGNWACSHPGLGRFFAAGWLKNHNCPTDPKDTTDPIIRSIDVIETTNTTATIKIISNEDIAASVAYGRDDAYGKLSSQTDYEKEQVVIVSGLDRNTRYHFTVTIRDRAGNTASSDDKTFTTRNLRSEDGSPAISNIKVDNVTATKAEIAWSTSERSTSRVYYSTSNSWNIGSFRIASDSVMRTEHSITLQNLNDDTKYFYVAESIDADGNISVSSPRSFTTE